MRRRSLLAAVPLVLTLTAGCSAFEDAAPPAEALETARTTFVDAGSVGFQETPNFSNMRYGAGLGVRYKLPFGPIRADIAFPLDAREDDAAFQLYISIGQAF